MTSRAPGPSAYYAAQRPTRRPAVTDAARVAAGRQLAEPHHCTSCHRPGLVGQEQAARLAGQDFGYLLRLLRGFKARTALDLPAPLPLRGRGDRNGPLSLGEERVGVRVAPVFTHSPAWVGSGATLVLI